MSDEKKPKRFDFGTVDKDKYAEDGRTLHVCNPDTGEETDIEIVLRGADSPTNKRIVNTQIAKYRLLPQSKISMDQIKADEIEQLAACTVSWQNVELDGKPLPFSHANAVMLYSRFSWLKDAVSAFIADRANYRRD